MTIWKSRFKSDLPDHLPEGRTTPVPGKGAGVSASAERRARVRRLVDALVVCQG